MRRNFSNLSPVVSGIDVMKFRNFIINKSDPLSKYLLPLFLSSPDSWRNTAFASHVSQSLDGKSRHFDIVSSREMHLIKVLFDRNPFVLCCIACC